MSDALLDELRYQRDHPLTAIERSVLAGLVEGKSNPLLARERFCAEKTIKSHVTSIIAKLNVTSRGEAAYLAHLTGLFVIEPSEIVARLVALRLR